ncbi:MAG: MotA/TolQ/ExbB proton channel family protein [Phycisphaerales bacterium JB037]
MRDPRVRHGRSRSRLWACAVTVALLATPAMAQDAAGTSIWGLFRQSFDLFSVLLLVGSFVAVAVIVRCVMDVRTRKILPRRAIERIEELARAERFGELKEFVRSDRSFVGVIVRAAAEHPTQTRSGMRESAELASSELCASWFRRIEPLNLLGNLGPLLGLAGTVWGMILAFTSLGSAGGEANPEILSLGIAKALFHTLLGLLLAIPCMAVFGHYRSVIDKACNRGMTIASRVIERLPASDEPNGAGT